MDRRIIERPHKYNKQGSMGRIAVAAIIHRWLGTNVRKWKWVKTEADKLEDTLEAKGFEVNVIKRKVISGLGLG